MTFTHEQYWHRRPGVRPFGVAERYIAHPLNVGAPENDEAPFANGAPIVAIEDIEGNCYPRRPELGETGRGIVIGTREDHEDFWNGHEDKVNYEQLVDEAVHVGVCPILELLRYRTQPTAANLAKYPWGFPPSAYHHGVTPALLRRRNAGLLAAAVKFGKSFKDYGKAATGTVREQADAALATVERMEAEARANIPPLPHDAHLYYQEGQMFLPVVAALDLALKQR